MTIDKCIAGLQNMIDWSDPYEIQEDVLESAIYYLKLVSLQMNAVKDFIGGNNDEQKTEN